MWKLATIPLLLLAGCSNMPIPVVEKLPVYHPAMPAPYAACPIRWEVVVVDGKPKVALSYDDNVTAAMCNKDIERFISQLITLTCHYRQELKESNCLDK